MTVASFSSGLECSLSDYVQMKRLYIGLSDTDRETEALKGLSTNMQARLAGIIEKFKTDQAASGSSFVTTIRNAIRMVTQEDFSTIKTDQKEQMEAVLSIWDRDARRLDDLVCGSEGDYGLFLRSMQLYFACQDLMKWGIEGGMDYLEPRAILWFFLNSPPSTFTGLDLPGCKLRSLPPIWEFSDVFHNLYTMNLSNNNLRYIPEGFPKLTNLTTLDMSGNQIESIPDSMGCLKKVENFSMSNNPLTTPIRSCVGSFLVLKDEYMPSQVIYCSNAYRSFMNREEMTLFLKKLQPMPSDTEKSRLVKTILIAKMALIGNEPISDLVHLSIDQINFLSGKIQPRDGYFCGDIHFETEAEKGVLEELRLLIGDRKTGYVFVSREGRRIRVHELRRILIKAFNRGEILIKTMSELLVKTGSELRKKDGFVL